MSSTQQEEDNPYEQVLKTPLKLKGDSGIVKKKKKKNKDKKRLVEISKIEEIPVEIKRTKAELAFQKMREKTQEERINNKASKTHKERVEEFNRHLDSLTEHFDIPKVSWTK